MCVEPKIESNTDTRFDTNIILWSARLEELVILQSLKKFPTCNETRGFIVVFTTALHLVLSRTDYSSSRLPILFLSDPF
jgi:hypothetical protein